MYSATPRLNAGLVMRNMVTAIGRTISEVSGRTFISRNPANMAGRLASEDWVESATDCAGRLARRKRKGPNPAPRIANIIAASQMRAPALTNIST